jgi:hypothetical protein
VAVASLGREDGAVFLWRATAAVDPWFGQGSWWAPSEAHARTYLTMPGFGGPVLYRAEVTPRAVLDLRVNAWAILGSLGYDRDDYGPGELDHELIWSLAPCLAADGHEWVIVRVADDEWLRTGPAAVLAARVE